MSRGPSRLFVIDTSVAKAAGETDHPVSKACRDFMRAMLDICHRMVMTSEISAEWNRRQSHYARKWRAAMVARKKCFMQIRHPLNWTSAFSLTRSEERYRKIYSSLKQHWKQTLASAPLIKLFIMPSPVHLKGNSCAIRSPGMIP